MRIEAAWPRPVDLTDAQLEQLGAGLPGFPAVIDGGMYVYARFDVDADDIATVLAAAVEIARRAYTAALDYADAADPIQLTAAPEDPGLIPGPLDLVGTVDVARMLDVKRQRAAQLADRLPVPVGHPSGAPAWVRAAVEATISTWDRRPGRRAAQPAGQ